MQEDVPPIGCVIMSGNNTTFYTVCGTNIITHLNIAVSLPNKQGRGGQSQRRFERHVEEARYNYVSKVIETLIRIYDRQLPLIVGGSAMLKTIMVDRLTQISTAPKVVRVVDIQYDQRMGLAELLKQCSDIITSIQIETERTWIGKFMQSVIMDDGLAVYGVNSIRYCLENGLLQVLIVHTEMDPSIETLAHTYQTECIVITDFLPEAKQIKMGFGGQVGLLRYQVVLPDFDEIEED